MQQKNRPILSPKRRERLCALQRTLGVSFSDINLLNRAFIHPSFTGEHGMAHSDSNQRLEFLGDSVIYIIGATYLYSSYPDAKEGVLTEKRITLIREETLAELAKHYKLGSYLLLSHGGVVSGIEKENSVLADTFEALVGAIYLDCGLESASDFFINALKEFNFI